MPTRLQWQWAPDSGHLRTFGRPDRAVAGPPTVHKVRRLTGVRATSTYSTTSTFTHPGVMLGLPQLDFVKNQIDGGFAPWTTEYTKMMNAKCDLAGSANNTRRFMDPSWVPSPVAIVIRDSSGANAVGDTDEQGDAIAAYANALDWYYTGNRASAVKATQILNAWSAVLQDHKFNTVDARDGLLQSGWTGSLWPRSAEIIKHTFTASGAEPVFDWVAFGAMLRRAHVHWVKDGWTGGGANWLQVMADAMIQMGVFLDDQAIFQKGLDNHREWALSSYWKTGDVNRWPQLAGLPVSPRILQPSQWNTTTQWDKSTTSFALMDSYWHNPSTYINGLQGEMYRDPHHMTFGFAATMNACETARLQGVDLYGEQQARYVPSIELACASIHDAYVENIKPPARLAAVYTTAQLSAWGAAGTTNNPQRISWVGFYNHYHNRMGISMPETLQTINDYVMPAGYRAALHMAFEPLTQNGTP